MYPDPELDPAVPGGAVPRWMPAFANLMVVMSCFFVLLLSFSGMDVRRYRQIAGAMAEGFGAAPDARAGTLPMGTGIIAHDFAPTAARPVPIGEPYRPEREWPELQRPAPVVEPEPEPQAEPASPAEAEPADAGLIARYRAEVQALIAQTRDDAAALAQQSADEIGRGEVEVEARGRTIVLRIRDGAAFAAATAELQPASRQLLRRLRDTLATRGGAITVGGHTEDAPAASTHLRSAWELSAARAAAVAQELLAEGKIDPRRLTVSGHAGTRPLVADDSAAHRARNSRVEIVVDQGFDAAARERLDALKAGDRAFWDALQLQDEAAPSSGGVH